MPSAWSRHGQRRAAGPAASAATRAAGPPIIEPSWCGRPGVGRARISAGAVGPGPSRRDASPATPPGAAAPGHRPGSGAWAWAAAGLDVAVHPLGHGPRPGSARSPRRWQERPRRRTPRRGRAGSRLSAKRDTTQNKARQAAAPASQRSVAGPVERQRRPRADRPRASAASGPSPRRSRGSSPAYSRPSTSARELLRDPTPASDADSKSRQPDRQRLLAAVHGLLRIATRPTMAILTTQARTRTAVPAPIIAGRPPGQPCRI